IAMPCCVLELFRCVQRLQQLFRFHVQTSPIFTAIVADIKRSCKAEIFSDFFFFSQKVSRNTGH
uniref:hypothetical protein n=1 Tax=Gemmiger formicilis TaxID=745368 RepID=UPI003FEF4665